jgi:hypothetical protein
MHIRAYEDEKDAILKNWRPEHNPKDLIEALEAVRVAHWDNLEADYRNQYLTRVSREPLDVIDRVLSSRRVLKDDAPWGMVVYRTSYRDGDDALWERMLREIWRGFIGSLEWHDRFDLLPRHQMVVMDDREAFRNATLDDVREHFHQWTIDELRRNWREPPMPEEEVAKVETARTEPVLGAEDCLHGARYTFCLVVDDVSLESLDEVSSPVVKLVTKRWGPGGYDPDELEDLRREGEEQFPGPNPGWEGGFTKHDLEYVGWMYRHVAEYVEIQNECDGPDDWLRFYIRPPLMDWRDDFSTAPGFWRRKGKSS